MRFWVCLLYTQRIKERYPDFGLTFAGEKFKGGGICVSRERKLMIQEGLWKAKRRKREKIYQRKARRSKEGRRRIKNVGNEIKPVSTLRKIDYDISVLHRLATF